MPVENDRKQQREGEQNCISDLVRSSVRENEGEVGDEDKGFSCCNVQIDRPHEVPLLTGKDQPAIVTLAAHLEERLVKLTESTRRTLQRQAANQMPSRSCDFHSSILAKLLIESNQ